MPMEQIWTEKYRPKDLDDLVGQDEVKKRLKGYLDKGTLPHLLFVGPPGTGKTTSALALTKDMHGDNWEANYKEFNASRARGINMIRDELKEFARTANLDVDWFKIVYIDEADALTSQAQSALRRTMEKFSGNCRFILSCNVASKIIDPIRSRCADFRYRRHDSQRVKDWIREIAEEEDLEITDDGLQTLVRASEGDLRKATNLLQMAAIKSEDIDEKVAKECIQETYPVDIKELIMTAVKNDFLDAREKLDTLLIEHNLSGEDILKEIHRKMYDIPMDEEKRKTLVKVMGEADFRMKQGSKERIHLEYLLAQIVYRT